MIVERLLCRAAIAQNLVGQFLSEKSYPGFHPWSSLLARSEYRASYNQADRLRDGMVAEGGI